MTPPIQRACTKCGRAFEPRSRIHRHCATCEPHGREHRSPTTQAQDAIYRRNRATVLAGSPPCALRLRCDGAPATTVDHIVPVSRGGTNALENLQPACGPCNRQKSDAPSQVAAADERRPSPSQSAPAALRLS